MRRLNPDDLARAHAALREWSGILLAYAFGSALQEDTHNRAMVEQELRGFHGR
jgi:hypothetical protein